MCAQQANGTADRSVARLAGRDRSRISGRSELAAAIRYALSRWEALTLILRDGRACIDNSAAERTMRPIAVGRRNWTFAGSDAGGERAAAIYSLIETAKLHALDPEAYLRRVIERVADYPVNRVAEPLPWNLPDIRPGLDQRRAAGKLVAAVITSAARTMLEILGGQVG